MKLRESENLATNMKVLICEIKFVDNSVKVSRKADNYQMRMRAYSNKISEPSLKNVSIVSKTTGKAEKSTPAHHKRNRNKGRKTPRRMRMR